jgi:integrase
VKGASIKAVQKRMGHATAAMTLDVYGHLFPDELDSIAERLDQVRADALEARRASRVWPQRGPTVSSIAESAGQRL